MLPLGGVVIYLTLETIAMQKTRRIIGVSLKSWKQMRISWNYIIKVFQKQILYLIA